jgi:hypothetical protein
MTTVTVTPTVVRITTNLDDSSLSSAASAASALESKNAAAASASGASSSASAAATSAATASGAAGGAFAAAAAQSASEAEQSELAAAASAASALAAAQASGEIPAYTTKSEANSALAGLAEGDIIQVLTDESRGNQRAVYRKESGSYVFKVYLPKTVAVYCDSVGGSDSNDGLSPTTAKQTLAAVIALAGVGVAFRPARGSRWFNGAADFSAFHFGDVLPYGSGNKPIIDGSRLVSGTWTQHGTYTNTWYIDVTFPNATSGNYAASKAAAWHPAMWDEDATDRSDEAYVTRALANDVVAGATLLPASQADILTVVDANAGTFCVFKTGSSEYEPRNTASNGTAFTFYLHTRDGSDPNSNGRSVYVVSQDGIATFGRGQRIHDMVFQRTGNKDAISRDATVAMPPEFFKGCEFYDMAVHGPVVGGALFVDCKAEASLHRDAQRDSAGGAFHNYRNNTSFGTGSGFGHKNLEAKGFAFAVYSHGAASTPPEHETFDVDGLKAFDCNFIFKTLETGSGGISKGARLRRVYARDCVGICPALDGVVYIEDADIRLKANSFVSTVQLGACIASHFGPTLKLKNALVMGDATVLIDALALGTGLTTDQMPTLYLIDSTVRGTFYDPGNTARRQQNIILENSHLGVVGFSAAGGGSDAWLTGDVTADATSQLECVHTSQQDMRTAYAGIDAAVLTGTWRQTWTKTIEVGDLGFVSTTRTGTYSGTDNGDGTATVTLNNSATLGRSVKITEGDGVGVDYVGRVVSNSGTTLVVAPPPAGAFTSKAVLRGYLAKKPFKDPETCAAISTDGLSARVADGELYTVGQFVRCKITLGGIETKFGVRKIASITGNVLTFDRACEWLKAKDNTQYNSVDGTTTTNRRPLPATFVISFGFPLFVRTVAADTQPAYSVEPVETGSAITSLMSSSGTLVLNATATAVSTQDTADGATQNFNAFSPEDGYFNAGLGVMVGDVLTLTADADIREHRLLFATDARFGSYAPSPDCRAAEIGIGFKGWR